MDFSPVNLEPPLTLKPVLLLHKSAVNKISSHGAEEGLAGKSLSLGVQITRISLGLVSNSHKISQTLLLG